MIREDNRIYTPDTMYHRQPKCEDIYFLDIKREIRRIERNQKRQKLTDEEKEHLEKEKQFWKNELNHIQNPQRKFKKKWRKMKPEKVKEKVEEMLKEEKEKGEKRVTLWMIVEKLQVEEKYIFQALDILNKEGKVSQPKHIRPHDIYRPGDSGWRDDIYDIL